MKSHQLPVRPRVRRPSAPSDYVGRRLASVLLVAGALVSLSAVALLEGAGMAVPFALAMGGLLFVAAATSGSSVAARRSGVAAIPVEHARAAGSSDHRRERPRDWGHAMQLGPDVEQVIGRQTGTRT